MGNMVSIQCGDALIGRFWDCIAHRSLYPCELEENLDALEAARDKLRELRNDVMRTVINQQRPETEQLHQVGLWLSTADNSIAQVNELLTRGAQERQKLCMAGCCSYSCISSYKFGKSVARTLNRITSLMGEADFKQVVVNAPAKQLQSDLEDLRNAREELGALKEDLKQRIALEEGPDSEMLQQVQLWLSMVQTVMAEADELIKDGPQEVGKLCSGDFSNYVFVGRVAKMLEDVASLRLKGDFNQVVRKVVTEPDYISELRGNLEDLRMKRQEIWALNEDLRIKVQLEQGPQKKPLQQVLLWLSNAKQLIEEADQLVTSGPQEIEKLQLGDFSNSLFVGKVARILECAISLKATRDFKQVVERALPERAVVRNQKPTVGTREMLAEAWTHLMKEEVGILGICGMGGVGKTTLLTEINNKFADTPNDFDVVIWVVVSKDLNLDKIRESIWKQMGSLDEKNFHNKAEDLFYVLKRKKFVLLLDDLWQQFDLEDIGVPLPNKDNGSKVVITTRSIAVCKQMEAVEIMRMEPLNWQEAWQLFQEKVGTIDATILPIAQNIAAECCGLPIALITIGRAMASRSTCGEWEHALQVLRRSASNLQGMEDEIYQGMEVHVFKRLKFSYDSLPNDTIRSCFLYCALFPEDFRILKEDLVHYWICEKFCSWSEGYSIIGTLIRQCLLEDKTEHVVLHDVIRDMALWIACKFEEKEKYFVQAGAQLVQLPELEAWEGAKRVSFIRNSFTTIDGNPRCSNLVTLFLGRNVNLERIKNGFFQFMTRLTVLDLSHAQIKELPLDISNLQSLEYLNLSFTRLQQLPKELNRLENLKYLNLQYTKKMRKIPAQVISNFSQLLVLNIFECGSKLLHEVEDNVLSNGDLLIEELQCLQNLSVLSMTIRSVSSLQRFCSNQKLLNCARALKVFRCEGAGFLNISPLQKAKLLKILYLYSNQDLEELVVEERTTPAPGSSNRDSLNFCSLTKVNVYKNSRIRDLTWLIFVPHLTVLRVMNNKEIEEIISTEKLSGSQVRGTEHSNLFAKLQMLLLDELPKLKIIHQKALPFPCLTRIYVEQCPSLKKLPLNSGSGKQGGFVIKAEATWWKNLTWEDNTTQAAFSLCFEEVIHKKEAAATQETR